MLRIIWSWHLKISCSKKGENYQGNWKCNGIPLQMPESQAPGFWLLCNKNRRASPEGEPNSINYCGRSSRFQLLTYHKSTIWSGISADMGKYILILIEGKTSRLLLDISDDEVILRTTAVTKLTFSLHFREFQAHSSCDYVSF